MYWYDLLPTELGWVGAMGSDRGLRRLTLPLPSPDAAWESLEIEGKDVPLREGSWAHLLPFVQAALRGGPDTPEWELSHAAGGARLRYEGIDVPLDVEGVAAFTLAAWRACARIPSGETRSYGWLAAEAGRPGAARAAGQAMARNRFPPLVPCHRVIGSTGSLHGYGGGLALKARLLEAEGWSPAGAEPFRLVTVRGARLRPGVDLDRPRALDAEEDEERFSR